MVLREDISRWFDEGLRTGAKWMVLTFDQLDQREFATYAVSETEARAIESSPRESETILEVYDLKQPKDAQIELLYCNALERIDNCSHDLALFRIHNPLPSSPSSSSSLTVSTHSPASASRRIRAPASKQARSSSSLTNNSKLFSNVDDETIFDPCASDYSYPCFSLNQISRKWLFHADEYISPSSEQGAATALHGALGALMSVYMLEGEHWSYAREKVEIGLVKGTSDCGNSSVSMGLASLYFRDKEEGVVALINCATTARFQLYVKTQGNISCLLDQHPMTKASLAGLKVGTYAPRREQSLTVLKGELKQCFANLPWNNAKFLAKLSKHSNLQKEITLDSIETFLFITGDLRTHWEKAESKEAEEIDSVVTSIFEPLLGMCCFPSAEQTPSFFLKQEEEGQIELEGARTMYRQFSIATGHVFEPIACLSVNRNSSMWTFLSTEAPDDHRQSTGIHIPFGMDDDDLGSKLATALVKTYRDDSDMLGQLVDSVTKRGNIPLIALKAGCLQNVDDVIQDERSKLTGTERRKALVERSGGVYCPQLHPLVHAPSSAHLCSHCEHPIGEGMLSCRVCDYDCCFECRPRAPSGQLKTSFRVYVRRLTNPKWKPFELRSLLIPVVCAGVSGILRDDNEEFFPQFVKIYMSGKPLSELSSVVAGSVLTFLTGPECKSMKQGPPPLTRAVSTVLQASLLLNGLTSTNLSVVQWKEFVVYAQWQVSNCVKRQWGDSEHTSCLYALAWCHLKGRVVKQNKAEAHRLFTYAANQGSPNALYFLGSYFIGGAAADPLKGAKGYRLLDVAASLGVLEAKFQMGRCWEEGLGVSSKSEKEALSHYRAAAEQGHSAAQLMVGVAFLNGKGVSQDTKEAVRWLHMAAAQEESAAHKILMTLSLKPPSHTKSGSSSSALPSPPPSSPSPSSSSSPLHFRHASEEGIVKVSKNDSSVSSHSREASLHGVKDFSNHSRENSTNGKSPAPPPPSKLSREESQKRVDEAKTVSRMGSIKNVEDAKTLVRLDSKKIDTKKEEAKPSKREEPPKPLKREESKGGASDSFKRAFAAAMQMDKPKLEKDAYVERSRSPGGAKTCLVVGCREDHKKHFCRFCKNENSTHFSSVCPKKPR